MNASRDRSAGSNQSKGKEMSLDAMKLALDELKSLQPIMANGLLEQRQLDCIDPPVDRAIGALLAAIEQAENQEQRIQPLISARARLQIEMRLVEQLLDDPDFETTASDMEFWGPLHDRLKERLAPRQWQGLTKREFLEAVEGLEDLEDCWVAIQAKLKGKNT